MADQKPILRRIEEFRKILNNYRISPHAQKILNETNLVVMSGLSGSGRNTVINRLVEQYDYFFIVSDTTRPPKLRNGQVEQDSIHYFFRSEDDFLRDLENGEFLEAEIIHNQQVSGVSIRELANANKSGKIAIHDFEYGGANNVAKAKPDAHIIALLPPNYDEWLRRLTERETMQTQELTNRMQTAEKVLENMLQNLNFKIIINDNIEACIKTIRDAVEKDNYTDEDKKQGVELARTMLERVRADLY